MLWKVKGTLKSHVAESVSFLFLGPAKKSLSNKRLLRVNLKACCKHCSTGNCGHSRDPCFSSQVQYSGSHLGGVQCSSPTKAALLPKV